MANVWTYSCAYEVKWSSTDCATTILTGACWKLVSVCNRRSHRISTPRFLGLLTGAQEP